MLHVFRLVMFCLKLFEVSIGVKCVSKGRILIKMTYILSSKIGTLGDQIES